MINRKSFIGLAAGAMGLAAIAKTQTSTARPYSSWRAIPQSGLRLPTLSHLRELAARMPGELPVRINVTKVADTIRPASVVVEGEDSDSKMTLARTVYQVVYENGSIMLDSGMDIETHRTFGKSIEPYYPENYRDVQRALKRANLIVFTHYHADHTAGVIRSESFDDLASKVWLTPDTLKLLVEHPHKETVKIDAEKTRDFIVCDFDTCYPLAPGMVIFKTPGHTPDSKMLYLQMKDGREYIHSVDSGWSMENVVRMKMKAASWVNENKEQLYAQYCWLNELMAKNPQLIVLCTHDNEQFNDFRQRGMLGSSLELS